MKFCSRSQLAVARGVAEAIGIPLREVPTDEGAVPEYVANEGESCLHCKDELYATLRAVNRENATDDDGGADVATHSGQVADVPAASDGDGEPEEEHEASPMTDLRRLSETHRWNPNASRGIPGTNLALLHSNKERNKNNSQSKVVDN